MLVRNARRHTLHKLLTRVQTALAQWCVAELGARTDEAYFKQCAERVAALSLDQVLDIAGARPLADACIESYRNLLRSTLPERLQAGLYDIVDGRVASYNSLDPLQLPDELLDALHHFDGRPLSEIRQSLEDDGLELDDALIRRLLDFRILIPVETE